MCNSPFCVYECRLRSYGLNHDQPKLFVQSQYGMSVVYLIYRWAVTLFFTCVVINSLFLQGKYIIYLTNQMMLLLTIVCLYQAVTSTTYYVKYRHVDIDVYEELPWFLKIQWMLYNVTAPGAFAVTILFWSFIYKGGPVLFNNLATHGLNSVYMLTDMCVNGTPVRLAHFYQVSVLGIAYAIFTAIYWAAGGTNTQGKPYIYEILDWGKHPARTALTLVILVFVVVPLIYCLVYGLHKLRVLIHHKCCRKSQSVGISDYGSQGNFDLKAVHI